MSAALACSAALLSVRALPGVSAASGLEIVGPGTAYIAGDNSVFLYEVSLGRPAAVQRRLRLCAGRAPPGAAAGAAAQCSAAECSALHPNAVDEEIPKKVKPDFEAIAALRYRGSDHIAVFGSASKAGVRDGIVLLDPATGARREFDGSSLFSSLRADGRVTGTAKLNLEAAAVLGGGSAGNGGGGGSAGGGGGGSTSSGGGGSTGGGGGGSNGSGGALALFQRGNVPGGFNSVALIDLSDFAAYLESVEAAGAGGNGGGDAAAGGGGGISAAAAAVPAPGYRVVHLRLPPIAEPAAAAAGGGAAAPREFPAGVSGAATVSARLGGGASVDGSQVDAEEMILLSASYEATLNEIDDGPVMGSRLALLPASVLLRAAEGGGKGGVGGAPAVVDLSGVSALVAAGGGGGGACAAGGGEGAGALALVKIEGVGAATCGCASSGGAAGGGGDGEVVVDVLAVTDPDGAESELLDVKFTVPLAALRAVGADLQA